MMCATEAATKTEQKLDGIRYWQRMIAHVHVRVPMEVFRAKSELESGEGGVTEGL